MSTKSLYTYTINKFLDYEPNDKMTKTKFLKEKGWELESVTCRFLDNLSFMMPEIVKTFRHKYNQRVLEVIYIYNSDKYRFVDIITDSFLEEEFTNTFTTVEDIEE